MWTWFSIFWTVLVLCSIGSRVWLCNPDQTDVVVAQSNFITAIGCYKSKCGTHCLNVFFCVHIKQGRVELKLRSLLATKSKNKREKEKSIYSCRKQEVKKDPPCMRDARPLETDAWKSGLDSKQKIGKKLAKLVPFMQEQTWKNLRLWW